jgi:DNA gyrase subunit A
MESGKATKFPIAEVPIYERTTKGVGAVSTKNPKIVGLVLIEPKENLDILFITEKGLGKKTSHEEYSLVHRRKMGCTAIVLKNKKDKLVGIAGIKEDDTVVAVSTVKLIKLRSKDIRQVKRPTKGVTLMKLGDGESVVSIGVEVAE